jgi:hypothetical protein
MSKTPNEVIADIKKKYSKQKLNEADTRFKIIDTILLDILHWQKDPLMLEVIKSSTRADYVLYGKNQKPLLIIEAKKTGSYFNLPSNINATDSYQKISLEKLFTDNSLRTAVIQAKESVRNLDVISAAYATVMFGYFFV